MKRVISICLALWLSVTCCYALETHSEQAESSESTAVVEIQPEQPPEIPPTEDGTTTTDSPPIVSEPEYITVDNTALLESINSNIETLITLISLLMYGFIPLFLAVFILYKLAHWFEDSFTDKYF